MFAYCTFFHATLPRTLGDSKNHSTYNNTIQYNTLIQYDTIQKYNKPTTVLQIWNVYKHIECNYSLTNETIFD